MERPDAVDDAGRDGTWTSALAAADAEADAADAADDTKAVGDAGIDDTGVSELARKIAEHANRRFDEGALDHHVADVPMDELGGYVVAVLNGDIPTETKHDGDSGRAAYWDGDKNAIVIENGDAGTVFTPAEGKTYYDDIW